MINADHTPITSLTNIENTLAYLMQTLNWPISQDSPAVDPYEVNWEYYPEDLGLKDSDFAKITTLQQMKPLTENQDWAVFFVEFDSRRMQISVLRKILGGLIFNKRNTDHKIWQKENLLFVCFWGEGKNRTIGFVHFSESEKGLPTLKALYFEPLSESREKLAQYEAQLSHLNWEYREQSAEWTAEWKKAFTTEYGAVIRDTARLTRELARSAQKIRKQILDVLAVESEKGYVHRLLRKFKDMLVHDMNENTFADMYAQTISYGLFSARCMAVDSKTVVEPVETTTQTFDPLKAIDSIPDTNPFLRELLREGLDSENIAVKKSIPFDELELANIVDLLQNTDIAAIVGDFNRQSRSGREDPVIHFYEDFLTEYDKETKTDRGVFYTPLPVVDFIVRSVDQILKSDFGISDGLACDERIAPDGRKKSETVPRVQILDPATGTGTFLRQTILQIKKNFDEKGGDWSRYVTLSLLHRLYGFELMMAPYAVAHMKLAMALKDTGYNFAAKTRLKVFLTNSLEEAGDTSGMQSLFEEDPIAVEAGQANRVKKEARINVVMGNPPYSVSSSNKGAWITELVADYKKDLNEKNIQPLSDDYIKFIRLGEEYVARHKSGVLAYISNNSFIDGLIHRQMRKHLLQTFDDIYILNLHGNSKKKETAPDGGKDENVFNIQQGVSINIFVKNDKKKNTSLAKVHYVDLFGEREAKLEFLNKTDFKNIEWQDVNYTKPRFYFVPKDFSAADEYEQGFKIDELMPVNTNGIKTHNDNELVSFEKFNTEDNQQYFYRVLDNRFVNYDLKKVVRHRFGVMKNMLKQNLSLIVSKQLSTFDFQHIWISDLLSDINSLSLQTKESSYVFPLYLYEDGYNTRRPNLNSRIVSQIEKATGLRFAEEEMSHGFESANAASLKTNQLSSETPLGVSNPCDNSPIFNSQFSPLNLLDYIYAVLHTPAYRAKYKEFLKIDFPCIPYPKSAEQFRALAKIGGELRQLHLMKSPAIDETPVTFCCSAPSQEVTTRKWDGGKVWINKTQYFDGVPESAWNFCIGGYQVADKYLKDRKGRALTAEEIRHYCRIIKVLMETARLMSALDGAWEI